MTNIQSKTQGTAENALMMSNIMRAARRWWWLILLSAVIAVGAAYRSAAHTPHYYRAGSTVMVGRVLQQANPDVNTFALLDRLTSFYANVATRQAVLDAAAKAVSPPTTAAAIAPRVQTRTISGTQFVEITYLDTDPLRAAAITNAIANELTKQSPTPSATQNQQQAKFAQDQLADLQVKISAAQTESKKLEDDISQSTSASAIADARDKLKELQTQVDTWRASYTNLLLLTQPSETNFLTVIEPAAVPSVPVGTSRTLVIGMGGILGIVVAFGGVLIIEYLDDTLRRPVDIPGQTRLTLLATVPRRRRNQERALAPFGTVRNALLENAPSTPLRVLVAAPRAHSGVTDTTIGLAQAFARAGRRVVLVDGNLCAPALHTALGVVPRYGLADAIANAQVLSGTLHQSNPVIPNLCIVPAGTAAGTDDALAAPSLGATLDALLTVTRADILLIDGGTIDESSSASRLLARHLTQIVLVATTRTRSRALRALADSLSESGARITGVIFNQDAARSVRGDESRLPSLLRLPTSMIAGLKHRSRHDPSEKNAPVPGPLHLVDPQVSARSGTSMHPIRSDARVSLIAED